MFAGPDTSQPWRAALLLRQQRRPGWVRREAGGRHPLFVTPGDVDGEQRWAAVAAGVAEEHHDPPVRCDGWPLVMEAGGQDALAGPVGLHDADGELPAALFGKGDVVAARRPDRGRIAAVAVVLAKRDALRGSAGRRHHIDLRLAAAVGFEADAA